MLITVPGTQWTLGVGSASNDDDDDLSLHHGANPRRRFFSLHLTQASF